MSDKFNQSIEDTIQSKPNGKPAVQEKFCPTCKRWQVVYVDQQHCLRCDTQLREK